MEANNPRPVGIRRRLAFVVLATAMAVLLQASEGQAGIGDPAPNTPNTPNMPDPGCAAAADASLPPGVTREALFRARMERAGQPSAAASSRPSSTCSREANAGS